MMHPIARLRPRSPAPRLLIALGCALLLATASIGAQESNEITLTLERMVQLGLQNSYRVRDLQLNIDRTRNNLRAQQAGLKSRVQLTLSAPQFQSISDYKWNSTLQRNELIHEDTRRWQADLSIRQPVILFGHPTNGELSFTNRIYRYTQFEDGAETNYYNRYFLGYDQPLFQPNRMKNDLEKAQLDLENAELNYVDDVVGLVDDYADDYYRLFEAAYDRVMAEELVQHLVEASDAASAGAAADPARQIEADQVRVELANAREDMQQSISSFRLQVEDLKQSMRLGPDVQIRLDPVLDVTPVTVDPDRAVELARTLTPQLRQLAIQRRKNEIDLDNTRGTNSFRVDMSFTYGREVQDPLFQNLWSQPRNSYTLDVHATVPIWDWGQRGFRIAASQINVDRTNLQIEQEESQVVTRVLSEIRNLEEFQQRALNMQQNMALAHQITEQSLDRYRGGEIGIVDMLQSISREDDTAGNFLDAFIGYRKSLQDLQQLTYYDFEHDVPLTSRYGIGTPPESK